jgi:hypothetical protein
VKLITLLKLRRGWLTVRVKGTSATRIKLNILFVFSTQDISRDGLKPGIHFVSFSGLLFLLTVLSGIVQCNYFNFFCGFSFGMRVVAVETSCQAMGAKMCQFVVAHINNIRKVLPVDSSEIGIGIDIAITSSLVKLLHVRVFFFHSHSSNQVCDQSNGISHH